MSRDLAALIETPTGRDDRLGSRVLAEALGTGLLVCAVVARTGRPHHLPWAVGAYITAAYWFTSSTSFANPAVTIARMFSDIFAGIAPASVPAFLGAQAVGAVLGYLTARTLYPCPTHQP